MAGELSMADHHERVMEGGAAALSWLDDELWQRFPLQLRGQPKAKSQFGAMYQTYGNGALWPEGLLIRQTDLQWEQLVKLTLEAISADAQAFQEPVAIVWRRPLEVRGHHLPAGKYHDYETGQEQVREKKEDKRIVTCRLHFLRYELVVNQVQELRSALIIQQKTAPRGL